MTEDLQTRQKRQAEFLTSLRQKISIKGIVWTAICAACLYLAIALWSGKALWSSLRLVSPILILTLLGVIFFSYVLRFFRWQLYLKQLGYVVPWRPNFQIFLSSFALTTSPGKAGEAIKSLLLKQWFDVPMPPTLAALFCERFTDAFSVVLLACFGLTTMLQSQHSGWAIFILAAIQALIILILQNPKRLGRYVLHPLSRIPVLKAITDKVESLLQSAGLLLRPQILTVGTLIALVAWGMEGIALYHIFQALGAHQVTVYEAIVIHTSAGLIGALSMLPGGIGGMEVAAISLSLLFGATQTQAIAATFLIRLMTLWFAVAIGIVALITVQRKPAA